MIEGNGIARRNVRASVVHDLASLVGTAEVGAAPPALAVCHRPERATYVQQAEPGIEEPMELWPDIPQPVRASLLPMAKKGVAPWHS